MLVHLRTEVMDSARFHCLSRLFLWPPETPLTYFPPITGCSQVNAIFYQLYAIIHAQESDGTTVKFDPSKRFSRVVLPPPDGPIM